MTAIPREPAQRHRAIAGRFSETVRGVADWDAPSPVPDWTARDVVRHLVQWLPALLEGGSDVRLPAGPSVDTDPAAAGQSHADAVQALLDDPATQRQEFTNPHTGTMPVDVAVDRFYTTDVFMHTWDLARATGQDDTLDAELSRQLLEGMEPIDELLRTSGQYGPRVPVPDDAPAHERLMGFVGRDPAWRSPGRRA